MDVSELQKLLIQILAAELNESESDAVWTADLTPDILPRLYEMAKKQDLAHIVSAFLYRRGLLSESEWLAKFNHEEIMAVYRYERMKYTYSQICEILNEANIPFVPLKGMVIRALYPNAYMRTSCDIDILVRENQLDAATEAFRKEQYRIGERSYHDVSMVSPSGMYVELHFTLREYIPALDSVLERAWDYATPVEGCRYAFTPAFFLFHIYAHMNYHFRKGGCGIQSLMDLWMMKSRSDVDVDAAEAAALLQEAGIDQFAACIDRLVEVCFAHAPSDEFSETLLTYIFNGEKFGTTQTRLAAQKVESKSTVTYAVKRLFLPYRDMAVQFPVLKKVPILLPACWMARLFRLAFPGKARKAVCELKTVGNVTAEQMAAVQDMFTRLGM